MSNSPAISRNAQGDIVTITPHCLTLTSTSSPLIMRTIPVAVRVEINWNKTTHLVDLDTLIASYTKELDHDLAESVAH